MLAGYAGVQRSNVEIGPLRWAKAKEKRRGLSNCKTSFIQNPSTADVLIKSTWRRGADYQQHGLLGIAGKTSAPHVQYYVGTWKQAWDHDEPPFHLHSSSGVLVMLPFESGGPPNQVAGF